MAAGAPSVEVQSVNRLPTRLSPLRAKDFYQCPKLFYYKTILGLSTPATLATAKGTLAHYVFERLFDHPRDERAADVAKSYVEPAWEVMTRPFKSRADVPTTSPEAALRDRDGVWTDEIIPGSDRAERLAASAADYLALAPPGSAVADQLLADTATSVDNYFAIERPWNFDPVGRELHLEATARGVSLHGFIDRLDRYTTSFGEERWVISDYKTGRVPSARYLDEAFFAMKVYAVLLAATHDVMPYSLRLIYVGASAGDAVKALPVDARLLESTEEKMAELWSGIVVAAETGVWPTKKSKLCDWCHFQSVCPAFHPGVEQPCPS